MPEITSRDRMLTKLRDFDERLNGALASTERIIQLKDEAGQFVKSLQESQEKSAEIQHDLQQIQQEWIELVPERKLPLVEFYAGDLCIGSHACGANFIFY